MGTIKSKTQAEDAARQCINGVVGAKGIKLPGNPMIANGVMRSLIQAASGMLNKALSSDSGSLGGAHSITIVTGGGSELFNAFVDRLCSPNFITGSATTSWSEAIDAMLSGSNPEISALVTEVYHLSDEDKKLFSRLLAPEMQTYLEQSSASRSIIRIQQGDKSMPYPSAEWKKFADEVKATIKNLKTYSQLMQESSGVPDYTKGPSWGPVNK